jgi:hypothetical protein
MSYIGRGTESISNVEVLDNLTFDGSASYTLQKSSVNFVPSSANNLLISISGVVQQGNFSVSGSTITFDTTVSASDTCDWILHYGTGLITTVADGAITEAKLGSNAVTTAKINDSAITSAKINNGAITSAKLDSGLALGKIGQVIQTVKTDTFSTTSSSFVDVTGLSATITPSASDSKVLIFVNLNVHSSDNSISARLYRGSTLIGAGDGSGNRSRSFGGSAYDGTLGSTVTMPFNTTFLDSPSTTSATTYKIQGGAVGGGTLYYGRTVNDTDNVQFARMTNTITLMEVLA